MLGAAAQVRRALGRVDIDAQTGRQTSTAIAILKSRLSAGQIAPVVVIHMGNNGTLSRRQFDEIMGLLSGARRVIILNNKVPRAWQDSNNNVITEGARRYPNVVLIDWVAASAEHPEYFWNDGIHLRPNGAQVYADLIARAVAAP
jgi:lysophospholipase L1-like esterase